jgi:hypothetical protein
MMECVFGILFVVKRKKNTSEEERDQQNHDKGYGIFSELEEQPSAKQKGQDEKNLNGSGDGKE